MSLCEPCRAEHDRWFDYRPFRAVPITAAAAYDLTSAGVTERTRARTEERSALIRRQQSMIRENCLRDHSAPTRKA